MSGKSVFIDCSLLKLDTLSALTPPINEHFHTEKKIDMEKREQLKSMEEYAAKLLLVASPEKAEEFKRLWVGGERVRAIQILRYYKILS